MSSDDVSITSHLQAAQTLEMVSQQAVVHQQDSQLLLDQGGRQDEDVTLVSQSQMVPQQVALVTQPQVSMVTQPLVSQTQVVMVSQPQLSMVTQPQVAMVASMHDYAVSSTPSVSAMRMSGGDIVTQTQVTQAEIQIPRVTAMHQLTPVSLPIMQHGNDNVQFTEEVLRMMQQQQQLNMAQKALKNYQQLKAQEQQQIDAMNQLQEQMQQNKVQVSIGQEMQAQMQVHGEQMHEDLQQQQLQIVHSSGQISNAPIYSSTDMSNQHLQLNQEQLQVQSVISLKDNMLTTQQLLQLQELKTGQHVIIGQPQVSTTEDNETQLQLQLVTETEATTKKQIVLPADAPPPPLIATDEELEDKQLQFDEPTGITYDDTGLWCEECGTNVRVMCRKHGELTKVRDRVIPSRAKLTAPHHVTIRVLELRAGGKNVYGVYARKVIQKRTQFGPYEGMLKDTWDYKGNSRLKLKLFEEDGTFKYLDCLNQEFCNWMIFVRPACCQSEINLVAYQYKMAIYYTSVKAIPPNEELRVWYAHDYGLAMGAPILPTSLEYKGFYAYDSDGQVIDEYDANMSGDYEMDTSHRPPSAIASQQQQQPQTTEHDIDSWICSACSKEFDSLEGFEQHTCGDNTRRTRNKRKGQAIKVEHRMIRVKQPKKHATSSTSALTEAPQEPISTRASRRKPQELAEQAEIVENIQNNIEDNDIQEIVDDDNDDPTYDENEDTELATEETLPIKKGPGRPKGSKKGKGGRYKRVKRPKDLYACEVCGKAFASENKLKSHTFSHTGEKPFICSYPECGKAFTSKFKQDRHELIHADSKHHACLYCQKTFSRKDHLKNHLRIHDPNKELHKCDKCGKEYASPFAFKTHLAFHAADEGELICGVCKEEFEVKDKLLTHLKIHAGARSVKDSAEKSQKCPYCEKLFFTKKDVKRHLVVHTKDRDFLCQFCPQRFGRRDHLVRHLNKAHSCEDVSLSPTGQSPETQTVKRPRNRHTQRSQNIQNMVVEGNTNTVMSELLQTVTRNMLVDNMQGGQEVREIEVQVIRSKDGSGQDVMIAPVSQGNIVTSMGALQQGIINYGGNVVAQSAQDSRLQGTFQTSREVSAVLSQPISEPIMSGHFVPPTYMPQQDDDSARQQQQQQMIQQLLQAQPSLLSGDPRFTIISQPLQTSQQLQQQAPHSIVYSNLPTMTLAGDQSQGQKAVLTSIASGEHGDQQLQIQQGGVVFTMKLLEHYSQQAQAAQNAENQ